MSTLSSTIFPCSTSVLLTFVTNLVFVVIISSDPTDDDRSIMTEQLETVPKEEKAERELRRSSLDKHKKEKPFKTGRGRISTPERKIAKKEPSTLSRDEVRRKKGSFNTPYYNIYIFIYLLSYCCTVLSGYSVVDDAHRNRISGGAFSWYNSEKPCARLTAPLAPFHCRLPY